MAGPVDPEHPGRIKDDELVAELDIWYLRKSTFWEIFNHWRETGRRNKAFWAWGAVYLFVFFVPLLLTGVAGPFFTNPDLEGLTLMILNPLAWAQTVIKFLLVWQGMNKQTRLLNLMRSNFLKCIPENKKNATNKIISDAVQSGNKLSNFGVWMDFWTCTIWNAIPPLRSDFVNFTLGIKIFGYTPPPGHNKVLGYWYPVDVDVVPWVYIIYVYEFICLNLAGFIIGIIEGLIAHLVTLYNAYMDVLKFLLEDMKKENNNVSYNRLVGIVKEHERLMTYGQDLCDMFNFMITFQMSTGLLILIITIFNFFLNTKNVDLVLMGKMVIFLMYTFVEVSLYCYLGDLMEEKSHEMGFAAYSSDWHTEGVKFRKTTLMIMLRSEKPLTLKFGRMYNINLIALMSLLQTAYSTAMFMSNITDEQALAAEAAQNAG